MALIHTPTPAPHAATATPESPAQKALSAATAALVVAMGCITMFLPPLLDSTVQSVLRTVFLGVALVVAIPLHVVFVGMAAHRMGRSVAGWVGLSALLFPVGSVAALILLGWFRSETETPAAA